MKLAQITILCIFVIFESTECQSPLSPCPRVFHYETDGYQWYGIIDIPSSPLGSTLSLDLMMSIKTRLPTRYVGRIELLGERSELLRQLLNGWNIRYKVYFPLLNIIPKVTAVTFNGRRLCSGPPARGSVITALNLRHTLNTGSNTAENNQHRYSMARPVTRRPVTTRYPVRQRPNPYINVNQYNNEYTRVTPTTDPNVFFVDEAEKPNPDTFATPPPAYISLVTTKRPPLNLNELDGICGVSKKQTNSLIVGGDSTTKGDWPWIIAMFVKKVSGLDFICSGSLISSRHALTAAHCVYQKNNRPVKVHEIVLKLGAFNLQDWTDRATKTVEIEDIQLHPAFDGGLVLTNDIAILLMAPLVFTDYILPVCLWTGNDDLNLVVGKKAIVVGWGRDENGLVATPEPRQASIPIVSTDTCRASRPEFFYLTTDYTLCAGGKDGTGPCNGDSGGGLFMNMNGRWMVRGIVSNSLKDVQKANTCNLNEYVVFTDAAKYTQWLRKLISE